MRICSFLPSNTEILFMLGLGPNIVGVTHECDYPPDALQIPNVVNSFVKPKELSSPEIDRVIKENREAGKSTYFVDLENLRAARPDIIITQELCEVCAVTGNETVDAIKSLDYTPEIISLYPRGLDDILQTIITIGEATETLKKAEEIVAGLRERIQSVKDKFKDERDCPRVFTLEWLDPPFAAGHWVPEMVEIAGGEAGIIKAHEPSREITWEEVEEFAPQISVVMVCGYDAYQTIDEIDSITSNSLWHRTPASKKGHVYITDANSYFSRPGPRIVDGLEILAKIIHPETFDYDPIPDSVINLRNYLYFQDTLG